MFLSSRCSSIISGAQMLDTRAEASQTRQIDPPASGLTHTHSPVVFFSFFPPKVGVTQAQTSLFTNLTQLRRS